MTARGSKPNVSLSAALFGPMKIGVTFGCMAPHIAASERAAELTRQLLAYACHAELKLP